MKTQSIGILFIVLIIILLVKPRLVNNIYKTILGRLLLIVIVIFFSTNNITLGLLVTLAIITAANQYGFFVEGMETQTTPTTVGEENTDVTGEQVVLTKSASDATKKKISELKQEIVDGVDKEDIKTAIMSKDSKTLPVAENATASDDVSAFTSGMLNKSSLEGFSSYASV